MKALTICFFITSIFGFGGQDWQDEVVLKAQACFKGKARMAEIVASPNASRSLIGYQVVYKRKWRGIEVVDHQPRMVQLDHHLEVWKIENAPDIPETFHIPEFNPQFESRAVAILAEKWVEKVRLDGEPEPLVWATSKGVVPAYRFRFQSEDGKPGLWEVVLHAATGQPLRVVNRLFSHKPTQGVGTILKQNPTLYRSETRPYPPEAYLSVPLQNLDGSGYLRGPYVDVTQPALDSVNYDGPSTLSFRHRNYFGGYAFSPQLEFHYSSDDPRFEEVMVYYWVNRAQQYLQDIGQNVMQRPIPVNCHMSATSNAFYNSINKKMFFGDGWVDTAEDAGVVRHEYGHAILDDMTGERLYNYLGAFFHEGFADYFDFLVGRADADVVGTDAYPHYLGELFGSFHLSAPFFLRTLTPPHHQYPYLTGQPHQDGRLWSSAFFELDMKLGTEIWSPILFEAIRLMTSAAPEDVMVAIHEADKRLFGGQYWNQMTAVFEARGFLNWDHVPFHEVTPGEALTAPPFENFIFARFEAPPGAESVKLTVSATFSVLRSVLLSGDNHPHDSDYELRKDNTWEVEWQLGKVTRPVLKPGGIYYLKVEAAHPVTISLEVIDGPLTLPAPQNEPLTLPTAQTGFLGLELNVPPGTRHLEIQHDLHTIKDYYTTLTLTRNYVRMEANSLEPYLSLETNNYYQIPNILVIDLPEPSTDSDHFFLSLASDAPNGKTVNISWRAVAPLELDLLQPGETLKGRLPESGWKEWVFRYDGVSPRLLFELDGDQELMVEDPYGFRIFGVKHESKKMLLFQENLTYWFTDSEPFWGIYLTEGNYRVRVTGAPGATFELGVSSNSPPVNTLIPGESQAVTLEPGELCIFAMETPEEAAELLLHFSSDDEEPLLQYNLVSDNFEYSGIITSSGYSYTKTTPYFRETADRTPFSDYMIPGVTYHVWIYRPLLSTTKNTSITWSWKAAEGEIPVLGASTRIEVPMDTPEYLHNNRWVVKPYRVEPPPGTRRIHFGINKISVSPRAGIFFQNPGHTYWGELLYDFEIGELEMRRPPDEPFTIWVGIPTDLDPVPGPAIFDIELQFHKDSANNASLSCGANVSDSELVSRTLHHTRVTIPPETEIVDFSWEPVSENGVRTQVKITPRMDFLLDQTPVDLSLSPSNRFFFSLDNTGDTPLAPNQYILQRLPPFTHLVGFDPAATPFTTRLSQYCYPLGFQRQWEAETVIGNLPVVEHQSFIYNPMSRMVTLSLISEGTTETLLLPPHGWREVRVNDGMRLDGDGTLIAYRVQSGEGWSASIVDSGLPVSSLRALHIPPGTSPWKTQLALSHMGDVEAVLEGVSEPQMLVPGSHVMDLSHQQPESQFFNITADISPSTQFPERVLSSVQFWSQGHQVGAEAHGRQGRRLIVPHIPNANQWWTGIYIANPGEAEVFIPVMIHFTNGETQYGIKSLKIPGGSSKTLLVNDLLVNESRQPAWLELLSEGGDITGLQFMGRHEGDDVAVLTLPSQESRALLYPGTLFRGIRGVAIGNLLNRSGEIKLEAIGSQGQTLGSQSFTFGPYEKRTCLLKDLFPELEGQSYVVRGISPLLRIMGMQIDLRQDGGLNAVSAIPEPLFQ